MKKFLMRFVPDDRDEILIFTFKCLLLSFAMIIGGFFLVWTIIVSNGFSLLALFVFMIWYVLTHGKDWTENDH